MTTLFYNLLSSFLFLLLFTAGSLRFLHLRLQFLLLLTELLITLFHLQKPLTKFCLLVRCDPFQVQNDSLHLLRLFLQALYLGVFLFDCGLEPLVLSKHVLVLGLGLTQILGQLADILLERIDMLNMLVQELKPLLPLLPFVPSQLISSLLPFIFKLLFQVSNFNLRFFESLLLLSRALGMLLTLNHKKLLCEVLFYRFQLMF